MSILDVVLDDNRSGVIGGGNPQTPAYWLQQLFGGGDTDSGVVINEANVLTLSAFWNGVNIISGAIGFLPLVLYRRIGPGRKERAYTHPVYSLLHDRPNPYMDALIFRETLQGHLLTWGNAYAEIERNGAGGPKWLWPMAPNKVAEDVYDNGSKIQYKYTTPQNTTRTIQFKNVLHIKGLGFDGVKGYSVVGHARNSLGAAKAVEQYGARFFKNNATPPSVLEHPKALTDDAEKHLRESWEKMHKGTENAGRIAILEEGMKLHQIGIPPEDAQYLSTRKFSVTEIARWLNIPPHMIKDLEKATFSNIEHLGIEFIVWTLTPWMKRWELETTYKLISKDQRKTFFAEFVPAALLRGDTKSRFDAYRIAIYSGWMNRNQARNFENMNSADGLDDYLQPLNYKVVGEPDPRVAGSSSANQAAARIPAIPGLPVHVEDHGDNRGNPGDNLGDPGDNREITTAIEDQRPENGDVPGVAPGLERTAGVDNPTDPPTDPDGCPGPVEGFHALFESTWRRIVTKEVNALRRIVKKPERRAELINEFYDKHFDHVVEVLGPVLKVFGADDQAIQDEARKYIDDSRSDLLAGLRFWDPEEILDGWKDDKALKMTEEFLTRGNDE